MGDVPALARALADSTWSDVESPDSEMRAIARLKKVRHGPFLLPGDRLSEVYIVRRGRVKAHVITPDGREFCVRVLGPGEMLCECWLFTDCRSLTFCSAVDYEVEFYVLRKALLEPYLLRRPELLSRVWRAAAEKADHLLWVSALLYLEPLERRIIHRLQELAEVPGLGHVGGEVAVTHSLLSELVGANRSSVSEKMSLLQRRGLIEAGRGRVRLKGAGARLE